MINAIKADQMLIILWELPFVYRETILFSTTKLASSIIVAFKTKSLLKYNETKMGIDNFKLDVSQAKTMVIPLHDLSYDPCGVMAIVVGNGHGDKSSNPRRGWLHFT